MIVTLKVGGIQDEAADLIVLGLFEDEASLGPAAAAVDAALGGQIAQLMADGDFAPKSKEQALLYTTGRAVAKRVLLVGLGKADRLTAESIRVAAGLAATRVLALGVKKYHTEVLGVNAGRVGLAEAVQAMVEGAGLALYEFTELKSGGNGGRGKVEEVVINLAHPAGLPEAEAGLAAGLAIVAGTSLTRDLVNWPGNYAKIGRASCRERV